MNEDKYKGKGLLVIGGGILQQQTFKICNELRIVDLIKLLAEEYNEIT
tara:strand:+ start:430 stop:573 length:144 start_codon:yes stop_codon:yes gene_type:complete